MTEKKLIAVVGATGSQGGGLVRAILADSDGEFAVRALTRNAQSGQERRSWRGRGAEVVEADLDDEASMRDAFEGRLRRVPRDELLGRADPGPRAAGEPAPRWNSRRPRSRRRRSADAGVQHVIWSTLEDTRGHFARRRRRAELWTTAGTRCRTSTPRARRTSSS